MAKTSNRSLIYTKVPVRGLPVLGEHMAWEDRPIDLTTCPPGGFTIKVIESSFDPYMRDRMRDPSIKSYLPPFNLGEPIITAQLGKVLVSENPKVQVGDIVYCTTPVAAYVHVAKETTYLPALWFHKVENKHNINPGHFLGALGIAGISGYASFYGLCQPKRNATIWVSGASGAVGQMVCQLAKMEGMRVIGSAGSDDKVKFVVEELGVDAAFNYKKEKLDEALTRLAPDGLDIYYDNIGGDHLEAAIDHMKTKGRIICCGYVSQYNIPRGEEYGVKNLGEIVRRQLSLIGYLTADPELGPKYFAEHQERVQKWIADETFKAKLHEFEGLDKAPEAFLSVFDGKSFGKAVVKVADP